MSINALASATSVQDLAKILTKRFDLDGNGELSGAEFAEVMKNLLADGQTDRPTSGAAGGSGAPGATSLPSAATAARETVGALAGFDPAKLANADHSTFKYKIGRILQHYPNTPQGLRDALPEIQQIVPGATITGTHGDKLDFGTYSDAKAGRIGVVDVLQAASVGGRAWQWAPIS